jgi:hypothetical protein
VKCGMTGGSSGPTFAVAFSATSVITTSVRSLSDQASNDALIRYSGVL